MTSAAANPWTRNWTIVSADLDIRHVMQPMTDFRLESAPVTAKHPATGKAPVYRIVHNKGAPVPDCFAGTLLRPVGTETPTFSDITKLQELPPYADDTADQYETVSELMSTFLTENTQVQRLEGVIRVRCHADGAKLADAALRGHAPLSIRTAVQLYQFGNALKGSLPLLVVRTPLSPICPTNGDGTALGFGR